MAIVSVPKVLREAWRRRHGWELVNQASGETKEGVIEMVASRFESRVDGLEKKVNSRVDALEGRLDSPSRH